MNPRTTLILAVLVALLGGFIYWTELRDGARDPEAEARAIFPDVEAAQLDALELRTSDGADARLVRSDGVWELAEPLAFPADGIAAEGLASSLATLESEAVFDEPEALSAYGLEVEPTLRFEAGGESHALRVGDKSPVGGNTYVAVEGDPRVFAVATWRINALEKALLDLRDRRILDFEASQVESLRARWPGGEVAAERAEADAPAGEGWRLLEPLEARASGDTIEGLLTTLQFLRASAFVDEPPSDEAAGLVDPSFEVELRMRGADGPPLRMALGQTLDGSKRLVRGAQAGVLYEVEEARLADLPTKLSAYRFKQLSEFDGDDARRFELAFEGGQEVAGSRSDAGWQTTPQPMAAGKAGRLVEELADLEATDIAAEDLGAEELAGFGLEPPRVKVGVFGGPEGEAETALAEIVLGNADLDRGIAAQRVGEPTVYWLPFELAEHLPVNFEAFENRFASGEDEEPEAPLDAMSFGDEDPAAAP